MQIAQTHVAVAPFSQLLARVEQAFQSALKINDEFRYINGILHYYPNVNREEFAYVNCQRSWLFADKLTVIKMTWNGEFTCPRRGCAIPAIDWLIFETATTAAFHINSREMHAIVEHDLRGEEAAKFEALYELLARVVIA